VLTGLMVLLFLRDWRSAFIVVVNIPLSLLGGVFALWITHQTINLMTLGGLALAVGILVDEATVAVENIHAHLARGQPLTFAALDAHASLHRSAPSASFSLGVLHLQGLVGFFEFTNFYRQTYFDITMENLLAAITFALAATIGATAPTAKAA
jgi:hypothetical protein